MQVLAIYCVSLSTATGGMAVGGEYPDFGDASPCSRVSWPITYSTQGVAKVKTLALPWIEPKYYLDRVRVERRISKASKSCF